jgi:hypothetical protein
VRDVWVRLSKTPGYVNLTGYCLLCRVFSKYPGIGSISYFQTGNSCNLGNIFRTLAIIDKKITNCRQVIEAFKEALKILAL